MRSNDDGRLLGVSGDLAALAKHLKHQNTQTPQTRIAHALLHRTQRRPEDRDPLLRVGGLVRHRPPGPGGTEPGGPHEPQVHAGDGRALSADLSPGPAPARPVRPVLRGPPDRPDRVLEGQPARARQSLGAVPEQPAALRRGDPHHVDGLLPRGHPLGHPPRRGLRPHRHLPLLRADLDPRLLLRLHPDHFRGRLAPGAGDRHPDLRHARGPRDPPRHGPALAHAAALGAGGDRRDRRALALRARPDARGRGPGLRAHRPRQGPPVGDGSLQACAAQRAACRS